MILIGGIPLWRGQHVLGRVAAELGEAGRGLDFLLEVVEVIEVVVDRFIKEAHFSYSVISFALLIIL